MHSKLLLYMFTLVLVVVMFIAVGLFFVGQFSTTTKKYSSNLTFQNEFYTRQIEKYFDDLSMMTEMLANDSSAIIDNYLNENGIGTIIHYPIPPHLSEAYRGLGHKKGDYPVTERYADTVLSIPMYTGMTGEEQQYTIACMNRFK